MYLLVTILSCRCAREYLLQQNDVSLKVNYGTCVHCQEPVTQYTV